MKARIDHTLGVNFMIQMAFSAGWGELNGNGHFVLRSQP